MKQLKMMTTGALVTGALILGACSREAEEVSVPAGLAPQIFTDSLFAVMNADRANYTQLIVARLGPTNGGFIAPGEYWEDNADGAPLPAQMFRYGAEKVAEVTDEFTYSLQSLWPVNSQNAPKTDLEQEGLQYVVDNPGQNFYGEETLGGVTYFTAVYPDVAVSAACISCHNEHFDSPRSDFTLGEVMGGVVIRVPMN